MKTKIKEVQEYFKQKLLSKEFEIINIDEYILELKIDLEYTFFIWIGNPTILGSKKIHHSRLSFINIELTDEDSIRLNEIISPVVNEFRREKLLAQKIKELEELKKEFNN